MRTGDQANVLRAVVLTQVPDPEAWPVRTCLRSLARSCVEVAADATADADQRNRGRSGIGANRPPGPRVAECRGAGRKPGNLPVAWRGPRLQPAKRRRYRRRRYGRSAPQTPRSQRWSRRPQAAAATPRSSVRCFHRRRWDRSCCRVVVATVVLRNWVHSLGHDLGSGRQDRVPLRAEGLDAITVSLARLRVIDEGVERVVVVGHWRRPSARLIVRSGTPSRLRDPRLAACDQRRPEESHCPEHALFPLQSLPTGKACTRAG